MPDEKNRATNKIMIAPILYINDSENIIAENNNIILAAPIFLVYK